MKTGPRVGDRADCARCHGPNPMMLTGLCSKCERTADLQAIAPPLQTLGREAYVRLQETFYEAMNHLSPGQGEAVALELEGFLNRWNQMSKSERDEALLCFIHDAALRDFNERHDEENT